MKDQILEVLNKIKSHGYQAYVVGGFPRDLYIGKINKDVDICTNATPDMISKIFETKDESGIKYGSLTIVYKDYKYEITTFRKEKKYKDNRVPLDVQYINNLKEDLERRDFIINTLCLDNDWNFIDLLGAKNDIDEKIIRTVGNSDKKIKEDCLRILRAIRFATVLNFNLSDELEKAIKKYKLNLKKLSFERKKQELDKIFNNPNVLYGINLMRNLGLMEALDLDDTYVRLTSPIGIWFQLDKNLKYPYSKLEKDIIKDIKELINENLNDKYILYKYNINNVLLTADIRNIFKEEIRLNYEGLTIKNRKDIDITSYEICSILNLDKRSILKEIYVDLEKNILYGKVDNNKKSIKEFLINEYNK